MVPTLTSPLNEVMLGFDASTLARSVPAAAAGEHMKAEMMPIRAAGRQDAARKEEIPASMLGWMCVSVEGKMCECCKCCLRKK